VLACLFYYSVCNPVLAQEEYVEGESYITGDLLGDSPNNWDGCFQVVQDGGWGGTTGGQCPNISFYGQINYGYIQNTLTNVAAINTALKNAGLETTGYTYSWLVKNADANYEDMNNPNSVDPFTVTITIKDENGGTLFSKTYDYGYWIDNWTRFSGSEVFDDPFSMDDIGELELSITGYDIGYWAGWYGPEFKEPDVRLQYRLRAVEDTTTEDLLFSQMCESDPTSDINCPGYQEAMLNSINASAGILVEEDNTLTQSLNTGGGNAFGEDLGTLEGTTVPGTETNTASNEVTTGVEDPVAEATGIEDPVAEATGIEDPVAEAGGVDVVQDPVAEELEADETGVAETTSAEPTKKGGVSLNSAQLSALSNAENATNSAISMAGNSAT